MLVTAQTDGGITTLTLNRPHQRNALSRDLIVRLLHELSRVVEARALILTGAAPAFSAGADLKERQNLSADELSTHTASIMKAADALAACPVPVIAAISGACLAGGAELALACDVRIAAPDAQFGFPEVHLGIFPGAGGPARLERLIGRGAARSLLFTGRRIDAAEALRLGLVQAVADDPLRLAGEWARQIAAASPRAIRALKAALLESQDQPLEQAQEVILRHRHPLDAGADYAEGLAAFRDNRRPNWPGSG